MRRTIGRIMMIVGIAAVLAALSLFIYNLWEADRADRSAQAVMDELAGAIGETDASDGVDIDGYVYIGYVSVPALGLDLPVMSDWSYEQLRISPCRYAGSASEGGFVICAHNYANHFGRLRELEEGDDVYFIDLDGGVWHYLVSAQEVLEPTAVEEMTDGGYDLTLFTCTYGGQARVTVRCDLVTEEED